MVDDEKPVVIMGSSASARTMADGTLRIAIDILPIDAIRAFELFGVPGSAVALARLSDEVAVDHYRPKADLKTEYGEYAKALRLSSFFRTAAVWRAVGTDAEYLEWVKRQKSALSGEFSEYHDDGEAYCVPAHVRRVELGAGTAQKPPYSAIPLTKMEHDTAHQKGDSAIGTNEWWHKMRIQYVSDWCWETLKAQLGFESWADMPPHVLVSWAQGADVVKSLPGIYRSFINEESEGDSQD